MDRDRRLTGNIRGQIDAARAPAGFEVNNPWKVCKYACFKITRRRILTIYTGRETHLLIHERHHGKDKVGIQGNPVYIVYRTSVKVYNHITASMQTGLSSEQYDYDSIRTQNQLPSNSTNTQSHNQLYNTTSALFLFSPSRSMQAWHNFWLDM